MPDTVALISVKDTTGDHAEVSGIGLALRLQNAVDGHHQVGRRARHGASMMGPDYTHWHGMYEVSKHYYTEFLPAVVHAAETKGPAMKRKYERLVDELLARGGLRLRGRQKSRPIDLILDEARQRNPPGLRHRGRSPPGRPHGRDAGPPGREAVHES